MKALLHFAALVVLLAVAPSQCLALRSIGILSTNEATEAGLEVRTTAAGPDAVWVEVEFETKGRFKEYNAETSSLMELYVRDGEKSLLAYAALREQQPKPGRVRVRFVANRPLLDKLVLTIVIGDGAAVGGAWELRLREFVNLSKIH